MALRRATRLAPGLAALAVRAAGLALGWLLSSATSGAQTSPTQTRAQATPTSDSGVMLPWLNLSPGDPISLSFEHEFAYDAGDAAQRLKVLRSDWDVNRVSLNIFEGELEVAARGKIAATRPTDIQSTVSMRRINVTRLLQFLNVPRAREVEAQLSGTIAVAALGGKWQRVDVDVIAHDGSVRVSRVLVHQLLSPAFGGGLKPEDVESTLNKFFPGERMIPFNGIQIEGNFEASVLRLSLPLRNEALSIDIDPNIDAGVLWQAWELLQNESLRGVREADWDLEIERTGLTGPGTPPKPRP